MPGEITQKLGFDASQAIDELRKLQNQLNQFKQGLQSTSGALRKFPSKAGPAIAAFKALASAAGQASVAVSQVGRAGAIPATVSNSVVYAGAAFNGLATQAQTAGSKVETAVTQSFSQAAKSADGLSQATTRAATAVKQGSVVTTSAANKAGSALETAGKKGTKAARALTLSWKTVARVVQAQIIVRSIAAITSAFTESQKAAADFSVSIGEVATISTGTIGSIDQISASVLELSRNLGLAAEEVAEGLYQTLSNQVVEAGDALRFEEQAAKLSIATNSELKSSVNALSSVMNSYNLEVSEVTNVSDVLFKTIELGRLRLSEFGDVLGRVAPLTEALGISYQEMSAAIAALTQKGVPAHTAITQLTQVSQKLLRPTEKLQALYKEWGVETGPEAIRRFGGLQGVLLKMKDATAGNDKEFADLLGRVRAMVGALNLTSNEGNALTAALKAMEEAAGSSEKAFRQVEETIGRRAVKAWNELKVSVLEFGLSLLEITTPLVEGLNVLVKNFDLVAAAMIALGGAALIMSGNFAISGITLVGLTGAVAALKVALLSLFPVLVAVGVAMGVAFAVRAIQDSLDKATELTELQEKSSEELTKTQEEQSRRRIKTTKKEFEARRKITGEYFSALSSDYKKDFDLFQASSKAIGATLNDALDNLISKRKQALQTIKDAVLDVDDAIKESMEEVAKTQDSIAEDAFQRELKHMSARQQVWAEIERTQQRAAKARKAYAEAGASEEAARAARELSHTAEKRAKDAISHAEELGHAGDLKRAEAELEKIRADRIRGETTFQLQRKKLQSDSHKEKISQLEDEGAKLEELISKIRKLADPLASQGVLKSLKSRRADAERIAELAPEIERSMDAAFDFSMFDKLKVTESMGKIRTELQGAFDKAEFNWTKVVADFEAELTAQTYTAEVELKIKNQHIIEEFVKRFGEVDPLGDLGQTTSKMEEVLEGIVEKYEGLNEIIEDENQKAIRGVEDALQRLQKDEWFTWFDNFSAAAVDSLSKTSEAYAAASGAAGEFTQDTKGVLPVTEQLRLKMIEAADTIKQAVTEQRALTLAEEISINKVLEYAKTVEEAGKLSSNASAQWRKAWHSIIEAAKAATKAAQAYKDQADIPPGTYSDALTSLDELRQKALDAAEGQAEITEEAGQTENELIGAKQAVIDLPSAAVTATEALANETDQAHQLKLELQGATQAQKELTAIQAQQITAGVGPEQVVSPEQTREELEAQAAAARQLTNELIIVDAQFGSVLQNIGAVTQAMVGTSDIAAQIAGSMDQAALSVGSLQDGFALITEQIGFSIESMGNLNISITSAATSIDIATSAAANWASQLNNCAAAGYSAASAMKAAASAAMAAAAACAQAAGACTGGGVAAYYGGYATRYRQAGGPASRGQDRIPIMAAPGEFIVSAKNARRFASELQAMNSGVTPNFRDRGGSITNVGDINVTVPGAETTQQTAREIASALRRELRRGTSRLN